MPVFLEGETSYTPSNGYEYGIELSHFPANSEGPHRWGMTEEQATQWVEECTEMGFKENAFRVVRRRVSAWETVEGSECG